MSVTRRGLIFDSETEARNYFRAQRNASKVSDLTTLDGIADNFRALANDVKIQGKEKYGTENAGLIAQLLAHFVADYYSTPMDAKACRNRLADIAQAIGCCSLETIRNIRNNT
jgi:hypothetical protein